jgi:hypothetical protein
VGGGCGERGWGWGGVGGVEVDDPSMDGTGRHDSRQIPSFRRRYKDQLLLICTVKSGGNGVSGFR